MFSFGVLQCYLSIWVESNLPIMPQWRSSLGEIVTYQWAWSLKVWLCLVLMGCFIDRRKRCGQWAGSLSLWKHVMRKKILKRRRITHQTGWNTVVQLPNWVSLFDVKEPSHWGGIKWVFYWKWQIREPGSYCLGSWTSLAVREWRFLYIAIGHVPLGFTFWLISGTCGLPSMVSDATFFKEFVLARLGAAIWWLQWM